MMGDQGGGALSPHANPYSSSPFSKTNGDHHHLTELSPSSDSTTTHLTLLKSAPSSNSNSSLFTFGGDEGLGTRLGDAFSEIRYTELTHWDLNLNSYSNDGVLTARDSDPYRPWEKEPGNQQAPPPAPTPTSSHQSPTSTTNNATLVHAPSTPTPENGISSTNQEKGSPTTLTPLTNVFPNFSETFPQGHPVQQQKLTLPSFQSQFHSFQEQAEQGNGGHVVATTAAPTLPSFHTLPAQRGVVGVGVYQPHGNPQQPHPQFDERHHAHIQIFPGQVQFGQLIAAAPPQQHHQQNGHNGLNGHHHGHGSPFQNGSFPQGTPTTIQLQELVPVSHTLLHITNGGKNSSEGLILHHPSEGHHLQHQPHPPHPPHININMPKYIHGGIVPGNDHLHPVETHLIAVNPQMLHQQQLLPPHNGNGNHHKMDGHPQQSPNGNGMMQNGIITPNGTPKRQPTGQRKRKNNMNNMEHQGLIDPHHPHPQDHLDAQVSSVSSSDSDYHRRPMNGNGNGMNGGMNTPTGNNGHHPPNGNMGMSHPHDGVDPGLDKPTKKKRKRCGECTGCQRKDNCGDCAPCRNDKSHQICKMRRCDKLTEKKTPKVKLKNQH